MIAFRFDDFGASSKEFELYGKSFIKVKGKTFPLPECLTNFLFLKRIPLWRGWAKYPEISVDRLHDYFSYLNENNLKASFAITAAWVDKNSKLTSYDKKFPDHVALMKEAIAAGNLEILNHGLTHCIVGEHTPKKFSSNRYFHREFYDWRNYEDIYNDLYESQNILTRCGFNSRILVPPGNVFGYKTIEAASSLGFDAINCNAESSKRYKIPIIGNENIVALHDRELIEGNFKLYPDCKINNTVFVSELLG